MAIFDLSGQAYGAKNDVEAKRMKACEAVLEFISNKPRVSHRAYGLDMK
jgi:hypothetical protein